LPARRAPSWSGPLLAWALRLGCVCRRRFCWLLWKQWGVLYLWPC